MFRALTVAVAAVLLSTAALAQGGGGKEQAKAVLLLISGDTTLIVGKYDSWNNCRDAMDAVNVKALQGGDVKEFEGIVMCVKTDIL